MVRKKAEKETLPLEALEGDEGKRKALESALDEINKRFGEGAVLKLSDAGHMQVDVIPSGSLGVDIAIGVGGIPRGRIVEIYGPESSGKTTLCLHVAAEAQKRGGVAAFIDMEHALDPTYAARIGVDLDRLFVSQPDTGEQALEIAETLIRSGAVDVIVVDSVAALVPRAEIEGEMGDSHVGLQARLMSQALRKLSGAIKQSNVAVLFTNQLREKVGVMYGCFSYQAPVLLADGTTMPIGRIVNQQLPVEVLSWNADNGCFEAKRVVSWFKNGLPVDQFSMGDNAIGELSQDFVTLVARYPDGTGFTKITSTPNHEIATPYGFVQAEDLELGDEILLRLPVPELALADGQPQASAAQAQAFIATPCQIVEIDWQVLRGKEAVRYNLQVEDNATYVVGQHVIVHNSPETQPGGRALKFYASVRLDIRKTESIKSGSDIVGNRTSVKVKKNKVAAPFRECEFDIMFFEKGISKVGEIIDLGVQLGLIEKRGAFFRYGETLLGQGRENAKQFLSENPTISGEIESALRKHFGLPPIA
jgi:RecA/RadA recombinase